MNTMQHESLFTDLTPEQAAVVEGGAIRLDTIEALSVSQDPIGGDELYINVDGRKILGGSMEQGGTLSINKTIGEKQFVSLYDADLWPNPDDPIGSSKALNRNTNFEYFDGGANGSLYRLNYTVV